MLKHFADLANEYPDNDNKARFFPILNESSIAPYGYPRFVAVCSDKFNIYRISHFFHDLIYNEKVWKETKYRILFQYPAILDSSFFIPKFY